MFLIAAVVQVSALPGMHYKQLFDNQTCSVESTIPKFNFKNAQYMCCFMWLQRNTRNNFLF